MCVRRGGGGGGGGAAGSAETTLASSSSHSTVLGLFFLGAVSSPSLAAASASLSLARMLFNPSLQPSHAWSIAVDVKL